MNVTEQYRGDCNSPQPTRFLKGTCLFSSTGRTCSYGTIQGTFSLVSVQKESLRAQADSRSTVWLLTEPCGSQWAAPGKQMASPRRSAFWASWVIASASSSITNLKPFLEDEKKAVGGRGFSCLQSAEVQLT